MGKFLGVFLLLISVVMIGQIFLAGALILSKIISSEGAADVYFLNIDPFPGYISGWWVWLFIVVYLLVGGLLFKVGVKLCGKVNNSPSPEAEPGEGYIYKPVIENINDDWFVTDGCCTLCNIPFMIAEDLFEIKSVDGNEEYCYISKQPKENEDLQKIKCQQAKTMVSHDHINNIFLDEENQAQMIVKFANHPKSTTRIPYHPTIRALHPYAS